MSQLRRGSINETSMPFAILEVTSVAKYEGLWLYTSDKGVLTKLQLSPDWKDREHGGGIDINKRKGQYNASPYVTLADVLDIMESCGYEVVHRDGNLLTFRRPPSAVMGNPRSGSISQ